jgi:hypothetical protein
MGEHTAVADAQSAIPAKVIATLQARAALAGFELVLLADGSLLMTRWGLVSRPLIDLAAAEAFLNRVGAPR